MRHPFIILPFACAMPALVLCACSSPANAPPEAGDAGGVSLGAPTYVPGDLPDASKPLVDGGYAGPDGSVVRADRFVSTVVSFTPGECAGFGLAKMPDVVLGPPVGGGAVQGGFDVVSLGFAGEIVLGFAPNAIVDGPGADFIVFENAFWAGGDPERPAADLGEISVSDDGVTWAAFPCTPSPKPPYGACAGWHPVDSAPGNGVSPVDPATAGGEAYDLHDVGLTQARFVRIRDMGTSTCAASKPKPTNVGFDLDAVAIVNAQIP